MKFLKRLSTLWWLSGLDIQQFKDILEIQDQSPTEAFMHITSNAGGEIIMPSPIKESFDEGRVKSIKDII